MDGKLKLKEDDMLSRSHRVSVTELRFKITVITLLILVRGTLHEI